MTILPGRTSPATGCSPFLPGRCSPLPSFCKTTVCRWRCVPRPLSCSEPRSCGRISAMRRQSGFSRPTRLSTAFWRCPRAAGESAFRLGWPLLIGGVIDLAGSGHRLCLARHDLAGARRCRRRMGNREFVRVPGRLHDAAPVRQGPAVPALRDRVDDSRQGAAVARAVRRDYSVDLARPLRDDDMGPAAQTDAEAIFDDVVFSGHRAPAFSIASVRC